MTDSTMELFRQKVWEYKIYLQKQQSAQESHEQIAEIVARHPEWIEQEPQLAELIEQCGSNTSK